MLLEVSKIDTYYGLSHILFGVSLKIEKGETVCILGRNGVGKTTLLRSIMGLTPPRRGSITFDGQEIQGKPPFEIARRGIGFVPEERIIFPDLTVRENLEIAAKKGKSGVSWTVEKVFDLFSILDERSNQAGGTLSGGEQQMLTIARTMMGNPTLLLLDEPSEGLAPLMVKKIEEQIQLLKSEGVTILLSEQNLNMAMKVSGRAYILEKGAVCWHGDTLKLKQEPEILHQYLGL